MTSQSCPLVTIGIPTYNRASSYLKEALQSALNQSYPNIEVIVSDNCSTDHTEVLAKGCAQPFLRYFKHPKNIRANDNFNFCLQQARGHYFLLLHDDDIIDRDFVEACINATGGDLSTGIIRTGTRLIDGNGNVCGETPNRAQGLTTAEFFAAWLTGRTAMYLCSTLFNTARLREIGGFKSKTDLFQDVLAEIQLAANFGRIDVQDVKASFRRHNDNNGSKARVNDWCEDSLFLLDTICDLAPELEYTLRQQGIGYFCRKNYGIASRIKSPIERVSAYMMIFRRFGYRYSPIHYMYHRLERKTRRAFALLLQHSL